MPISPIKSLQDAYKYTTTAKAYKDHVTKVPPQHTCRSCSHETQRRWKISDQSSSRSNICHMMHFTISTNWLLTCQISCMRYAHILIWYAFAATEELLDELDQLDRVLLVQSPIHPSCCHMTPFNWVVFMYQHLLSYKLFKEAPVIPVAFLIHERKLQACHDELFGICCKVAYVHPEENKEAHGYWWGTGLCKHHCSVPTSSSSPQMLEPCAKRCKKMVSKPQSSSTGCVCVSHWYNWAFPSTNMQTKITWMNGS